MNEKKYNRLTAAIVFIASFWIYLLTLAPTVWFIDSGELSAVASTLGIAHPTGYPLFTLVGYIFSKLPISSSEVYRLNLMSAFFCSLGALIFFFFMKYVFTLTESGKIAEKIKKPAAKKEEKTKTVIVKKDILILFVIPATSALILAFSRTYWATANSVEVYPLHLFFITLLPLVFLKAIMGTRPAEVSESFARQNKYYLLFAFVLGLSFTNHLTTILLAPACLTLFFYTNLYDKKRMWKLLGLMTLLFLIGFSLYLYLPVRANMQPDFLWGNPYNMERFRWHITGKQFSVWIFSAKGSVPAFLLLIIIAVGLAVAGLVKQKKLNANFHFIFFAVTAFVGFLIINSSEKIVVQQFNKFITSLWVEFGSGVILICLLGAYYLSKKNVTIFYFTFLTFFGCLFYSVNYDIYDIYSYFLLAYVTMAVWTGYGIVFIYESARNYLKSNSSRLVFAAVCLLLVILPLNSNYSWNDESKNYYVEEMTMNVFRNAEPNSIIISSQWDFWVSASWYFSFVKNIRTDLIIIDKELLRRSWYYVFLKRHYPELYNNSKDEIERFLVELDKFEHGTPYDQNTIVKAFEDMVTSFVTRNPNRRAYVTWEIEQNKQEYFAKDYGRLSDGILFRLVKPEDVARDKVADYAIYDFQFTPITKTDYYHETLSLTYAMMLTNSAGWLLGQGKLEEGKTYLELALKAKPTYPQALELKRRYGL